MTQVFRDGELIAERFEIVRLIAEGGMGQVYEAKDDVLGGHVALKLLNMPNIDDPQVNRRFRREIQLARQVTHANVCRLYDVYQHHITRRHRPDLEVTLVTMELLEGETLESYLRRQGRLSEARALPLIRQMSDALVAAHAAGVIHRDFKPSNVMLVPREDGDGVRVVVSDFGLARSTRHTATSTTPLTGELKVVGTADYMAPEQLRGDEVSPASDVYALGVAIFEMVTGGRPYSATNALTLITKRATEPPASPLDHHPGLDPRWAEVILLCLEQDPENRPPSSADVVRLLSETGAPLPPEPAAPPSRRGSLALALVAGVLAVGLVVLLALRHQPALETFQQGVQLTTAPGLELDPAFSPDGGAVAFSSDESGPFEIYVRGLGPGTPARQLTDDGAQNFEPAFSPDGELVAYHSLGGGGIWVVPAAGGTPRRISAEGSRPAFSPDGSSLVFQSESSPQISDNVPPALGLSTLWIAGLDGGGRRQLTRAGIPAGGHAAAAFSPDGESVAFTASQRGSSEIWSLPLEGGDPVRLVASPNPAYDPVYSSDGKHLYFAGVSRQVFALWALPLTRRGQPAGEPILIRNLGLASIRLAAFSADGDKMAYTTLATVSDLWSLPVTAAGEPLGGARPLTAGGRNTRPAFSPGGRRLAYEHWTRGTTGVNVWTMDGDGANAAQLTLDPANDTQPSWFVDGRLVFLRKADDRYHLRSIEPAGGRDQFLREMPPDAGWARLSPDGTRLAYHSKADELALQLHVLDLATGEALQLTRGAQLMGFPCWSPDGTHLSFQAKKGEHQQMMLIAADGSGEAVALTDREAQHYPFSFSPDGRRIVFASDRDGDWNLWWLDHETGEERRLTDLSLLAGYVRYPAWSPRGDQIVYELARSTGDVWVAERTR